VIDVIDLITIVALMFCAGLSVKAVDWIDDERNGKNLLKWPLAVLYGALLGFLISGSPIAMLLLGALFAQVFARKIDTHTHVVGFAIAMLSPFVLGFPQFDPLLFVFFALLAFVDEMVFVGKLGWLTEHRVFLIIGSALLIPFYGFAYFVGILAFDVGYVLFSWVARRLVPAPGPSRRRPAPSSF
jgi:hypothetical protein